MVNDTSTLNGSLRQLGEIMADNLTQQGVPSTYDEGLTTLAMKILDIQGGPGFNGITLVADKYIISCADGEYINLTAQLTNNGAAAVLDDRIVIFEVRKSSDDTLREILMSTTNQTGTATAEYYAHGAGDVYVQAVSYDIYSNSVNIVDALLYRPMLQEGDDVVINISNISIPTNFKATFKIKQLRNYNSMGGIYIGSNNSNKILFGKIGSNGFLGIYVYKNGSAIANIHQENVYQNYQVTETEYTYVDGVQTITANGVTLSLSNSEIIERNYLNTRISNGGATITDLLIKPL